MGAGDLITKAWQVELQGVLMSANDPCAPLVIQKWFKGLGVPPTRQNNVAKPMDHGSFAGPQYVGERQLILTVMAQSGTPAGLRAQLALLASAFAPVPDTTPGLVVPMAVSFDDPAHVFVIYGHPRRADFVYEQVLQSYLYNKDTGATAGLPFGPFSDGMVCEFMGTDPRWYDYVSQSVTVGLGSQSGGMGFPLRFPFGFGTSLPGQALIVNNGNTTSYPQLLFTAGALGLSGIVVSKPNTGESWSINLSMNPGDTLLVDMLAHTAIYNGTADRSPFVILPPSVWWGIDPLSVSGPLGTRVNFSASAGAGSTCRITSSSAWWF